MDAVISSVQENPLYLGILIGMGALLLVSLAKQLIKMALLTASWWKVGSSFRDEEPGVGFGQAVRDCSSLDVRIGKGCRKGAQPISALRS